jgi:RNA polymerase sigma-70 factor (ECF subfamily)
MKGGIRMDIEPFRADGDMSAIVERYKSMIYGIALTHTRNQSDADDVFQSVFLVYFQKDRAFNEEEHRKAWLIKTTINCCKKVSGSAWRRWTVPLEDAPEQVFTFSSDEENLVYIALRELPAKYRNILHLFYFEDLPVDEIGKILGIRAGTVRMQLKRGREMMRERLKGDYFYE